MVLKMLTADPDREMDNIAVPGFHVCGQQKDNSDARWLDGAPDRGAAHHGFGRIGLPSPTEAVLTPGRRDLAGTVSTDCGSAAGPA